MWPGYGESMAPYHSPILVLDITPLDDGAFALELGNMGYAQGVQMMTYRLRTLRHQQHYLLAEVLDSDRAVAHRAD